jgi:isoleucyl-tRNA synthetase
MNQAVPQPSDKRVYEPTLFLPRTDFPMRSGHAATEPALLARWERLDLSARLRAAGAGRPRFVVHDGPPYANGHLHMGHALNKVLKDFVCRSRRMAGEDSTLVPGWDCHGLPVEWQVEKAFREAGRPKETVPVAEFRKACRDYAAGWLDVQRGEFRRLGVQAEWDRPYSTMDFRSEARVAAELLRLAGDGQLVRGSKPVMWSVVEGTALAEAEVEYHERVSDTVHAAFAVRSDAAAGPLAGALVPVWTTTPWTLPANRAVSFNPGLAYGLHACGGRRFLVADRLADAFLGLLGGTPERVGDVDASALGALTLDHPLAGHMTGYAYPVPMLAGDHVTDEAGTGFVHTAPGHGREDHDVWMRHAGELAARGLDVSVPFTLGGDGRLTEACPGFEGRRVLTQHGGKGDADAAVTEAVEAAGTLLARGAHRHPYPHSWRSKKPVVFRNTPQWFVSLDRPVGGLGGRTLRAVAREEAAAARFVPAHGANRLDGMLRDRPDWLVSRQRAWGVPLCVFVERETGSLLRDPDVDARVLAAFEAEGADAWFAPGAAARFLGPGRDPEAFEKVDDVLDVWFDSGSTHAFVLDDAEAFPAFAGLRRARDGGRDTVMYLEGSDQHRGWFQSSLLESCATRGRAPFDVVLTHGFVLDEAKEKMSKSRGNVTAPQALVADAGADVLRLWVAAADPTGDLRVGPDTVDAAKEGYRKLRNTLRWLLGNLAHRDRDASPPVALPDLERFVLHRLHGLDAEVRAAYAAFDFRRALTALQGFMTVDLSAFYFEARKDVLYCDPASSAVRAAALWTMEETFSRLAAWLAPLLPFLAEEAWLERHPSEDGSVHLLGFPDTPAEWRDDALAARWESARRVRRVVMAALEAERGAKRLKAGLEASPRVHVLDPGLLGDLAGLDLAEACVTSGLELVAGPGPEAAFRLPEVHGVAVEPLRAGGGRCARSWRWSTELGADPGHPELCPRDARAMREWRERVPA